MATWLAFYLIAPSCSTLHLNSHIPQMTIFVRGLSTSTHTFLLANNSTSLLQAACHSALSYASIANLSDRGADSVEPMMEAEYTSGRKSNAGSLLISKARWNIPLYETCLYFVREEVQRGSELKLCGRLDETFWRS